MPKFIELVTTENVTEIRNLSTCILLKPRTKPLFLLNMPLTRSCI